MRGDATFYDQLKETRQKLVDVPGRLKSGEIGCEFVSKVWLFYSSWLLVMKRT